MLAIPDQQVNRAARAIIDLINSRPTTPGQHEIATIIERIVAQSVERVPDRHDLVDCKALDREYGPIISAIRS
jgi:hypothetical protein